MVLEPGLADQAAALLAAHGERFMSLFDDHDSQPAVKHSESNTGTSADSASPSDRHENGSPFLPFSCPLLAEHTKRSSKRKRKAKAAATGITSAAAAAASPPGPWKAPHPGTGKQGLTQQPPSKRQKQQQQQQQQQLLLQPPRSPGLHSPTEAPGRDHADETLEDMIVRRRHSLAVAAAQQAKREQASGGGGGRGGGQSAPFVAAVAAAAGGRRLLQARPASFVDARRERKLFMSSKPGHVHAAVKGSTAAPVGGGNSAGMDTDDGMQLSMEAFQKLHAEVEVFGVSALDKKARKKWESQQLQKLGSKGHIGPAMAARIGKGVAAKRAEREARALEEACAAGMVKRKGLGKKRREAERAKVRDPGLQEAGPSFKNGVLRLQSSPVAKKTSGAGGKRFAR